jgi:hypothetical protein
MLSWDFHLVLLLQPAWIFDQNLGSLNGYIRIIEASVVNQ